MTRLGNYARDVETGDPFTTGTAVIYGPDGVPITSVAPNGVTGRWFYEANGSPGKTRTVYSGAGQTRVIEGDAFGQAGSLFESEIPGALQGFGDGPVGSSHLALSAPGGMNVRVGIGYCLILGVLLPIYTATDCVVAAAHASLPRIDNVVGRLTRTGTYAGKTECLVVAGTPAASPVAPTLTQDANTWEVKLGQLSLTAAASAVTSGMLTTTGRQLAHRHTIAQTVTATPRTVTQSHGDGLAAHSSLCAAGEVCVGGGIELSIGTNSLGPFVTANTYDFGVGNGWRGVTSSNRGVIFNVSVTAVCLSVLLNVNDVRG